MNDKHAEPWLFQDMDAAVWAAQGQGRDFSLLTVVNGYESGHLAVAYAGKQRSVENLAYLTKKGGWSDAYGYCFSLVPPGQLARQQTGMSKEER